MFYRLLEPRLQNNILTRIASFIRWICLSDAKNYIQSLTSEALEKPVDHDINSYELKLPPFYDEKLFKRYVSLCLFCIIKYFQNLIYIIHTSIGQYLLIFTIVLSNANINKQFGFKEVIFNHFLNNFFFVTCSL